MFDFLCNNSFKIYLAQNSSFSFDFGKNRFLNQLKAGIHHFDISNNCLGEIPDGINSLLSLTHLNISNNFIENLPSSLFQLTQEHIVSNPVLKNAL